jgi:group II intron reverse transcriptase/maturase
VEGIGQAIAEVPAEVLAAQLDLAAAWEQVQANAGMPGADGVSVRHFALYREGILAGLRRRLAREVYRPFPLRLAEMAKKNGGARMLLVPTVTDRVVQTAATRWLNGRCNEHFDPSSFAYRPGMGVHDALRQIIDLRDRGYRWILDGDITSFFDSISHSILLEQLQAWLGSASPMLKWLSGWIHATVWDGERIACLDRGVPQGSPLSPFLANFYLDTFDRHLRQARIAFIRYADDFLVLARTPFEMKEYREKVEQSLASLGLELSAEKTRNTSFDRGFRFLGAEIKSDSVLIPFEKKKVKAKPVYVSPTMPFSIQRAYNAGALKLGSWRWQPHTKQKARCQPVKEHAALRRLAGLSGALGNLRIMPGMSAKNKLSGD